MSHPSLRDLHNGAARRLIHWTPEDLLALAARFGIGAIFWLSGRTKVDGLLHVTDGAIALLRDEFKLPLIAPELAAHLAAYAEHLFPLLLFAGLCTRFSALALLGMTAVIEIFVYPDAYPMHGVWAAVLLFLVARGAGPLSLDALVARRFGGR